MATQTPYPEGTAVQDGDDIKRIANKILAVATDISSVGGGGGSSASRSTFSKATYNVLATDTYVAQVGVYAPGTDSGGATVVQLPDATTLTPGTMITVADESGSIRPWYRLAVTPYGTQLIDSFNLPAILNAPYETEQFICTGTGWKTVQRLKSNQTGMHLDGALTRGQVHFFHDLDLVGASSTTSNPIRMAASGGRVIPLSSQGSRDGAFGLIEVDAGTGSGHYGLASISDPNQTKRNNTGTKRYVEILASLNGAATAIDATNDYIARVGHSNTRNASAPTDGMWFCIDRAQSDSKLCIACAKSGTGTTLEVTNIDIPATNTGHRYGVEVNDALTECYFFYDDTYVGTLTTTTPLATSADSPFAQAVWVAGSQKGFWVDYFRYHYIINANLLRVTE